MKGKKIRTYPKIKKLQKKCSIKNHNLCDKNTILHNSNIFNLWLVHAFTFAPSYPLCIYFPHTIYLITKNHINLYHLLFMKQKKEVKRRLNTMPNIKMTLSWLFPHSKCKNIFHSHLLHWHWFFTNNLLNNFNVST
jgi:hypothetical protein